MIIRKNLLLWWTFLLVWIGNNLLFSQLVCGQEQPAKITEILILGNKNVATEAIRSLLRSQVGDDYQETLMLLDRRTILQMGYFYEDSVRARPEFTPEGVRLIFEVREHPVISRIVFSGNTVLSSEELQSVMTSKLGNVMNSNDVVKDLQAIQSLYTQKGYQAIVSGEPEAMIDENGVLTIPILEVTVEAIRIVGLRKTKTYVVLREIRTKPGEVFNANKFQKDLERLVNLDLFQQVGPPNFLPGSAPGKFIIELPIKEKKTGAISLAVGFSQPQGLIGRVELSETNLRGKAEALSSMVEFGGRAGRTSYELNFYEPYLTRNRTSLSVSVFNKIIYRFANDVITGPQVHDTSNFFNEIRRGGTITLSQPVGETRRAVLSFRTENLDLNIPKDLQLNPLYPQFFSQSGQVTSITLRGIQDTRDLIVNPARGSLITLGTEVGNSDVKPAVRGFFNKMTVDLRKYLSRGRRKTLTEHKTVVAGRLLFGWATGSIPFAEQFFVGGAETLRGYRESRFWGKRMLLINLEYRKPLTTNLGGVLFMDIGDAWGTPFPLILPGDVKGRFTQHSNFSPRIGVGAGIRLVTPIGPIRLDIGFGSEGSRTHFSIGHQF